MSEEKKPCKFKIGDKVTPDKKCKAVNWGKEEVDLGEDYTVEDIWHYPTRGWVIHLFGVESSYMADWFIGAED